MGKYRQNASEIWAKKCVFWAWGSHNSNTKNRKNFFLMQNFSKPYVDVPIRFWASIVQTLPRYEQKSDFSNFSGSHNSNTKNRKKFFLMQNVLKPFIDVPIRFWASIVQTLPRYEQKSAFFRVLNEKIQILFWPLFLAKFQILQSIFRPLLLLRSSWKFFYMCIPDDNAIFCHLWITTMLNYAVINLLKF